MVLEKEELRSRLSAAAGKSTCAVPPGKVAEQLRRSADYRQAKRIFAGPAAALAQVRVNALLDGKELIMPGPGLKDGFFCCKPFTVPFKVLTYATTYEGLAKYGKLLSRGQLAKSPIDILITDALAIDKQGGVIGDGLGFFDLSSAILAHLGAVTENTSFYAVTGEEQLYDEILPQEPWDIKVEYVITPEREVVTQKKAGELPKIYWENLPVGRIRKMTPLWKIYTACGMDKLPKVR